MSEFRLWVHHQIARLDRASERRFVALAAALIFAVLAVGPQALRVVDAQVNAPDIRIDELGANPVSNPVRFKATMLNVQLGNLDFLVKMPDGSTLTLLGQRTTSDPSIWNSPDFTGVPGQSYEVRARGFSPTSNIAVESSQAVVFSIFDPNSGGTTAPPPPTGDTTVKTVVLQQLVAFPGTEPKIEARGRHDGFTAESAFFRIRSLSGLAFLGERDAFFENDAWHGIYAVPGGSLYQVTLVAREGATLRESDPLTVAVPVAETPTTEPDPNLPPPPPPAAIFLLLPDASASLTSPVTLAARVSNASATTVIFEVLDPAGVTRQVPGQPEAAGGWSAMFFGEAGQYGVGVRASLSDGSIVSSTEFRSFGILAAPTNVEPPPDATTSPEPAPLPTAEESAAAPFIELFSPAPDAPPFSGAVPFTARVRNGLPDRVVAVVIGPSGGETVVIASKTATGDFWNALFEGPDGEYRFRIRALVAGVEVFSTDRRFAIKRPAAATTTPPPPPIVSGTPPLGDDVDAPIGPDRTLETAPPNGDASEPPTNVPIVPRPVLKDFPIDMAVVEGSISEAMRLECRNAGIFPERCAEWLRAKYQSRECLDAGALTREACSAVLERLNITPDESKLMGLAPLSAITQAREDAGKIFAAPVRREDLPASISSLLPVERDQRAFVRLMEVANPGEASSPALIVLDTDGDGLPNDVERRFGTDPKAPDTDGDGFSDGEEVKNGYNPLGSGTLERPVRGVERALIDGRSIEEPRGAAAAADPSFTIASAEAVPEAEADDEDVIRLSGTAAPNSVVSIFVYSYLPVVVTTTTDENGNWTYDFGSKLAEGRHEAYVSVNDETGKLVAASSPLAFFVREAQAVSEEEFLRPDVNVEETPATLSRLFVYGGIGLVLLALVLVFAIVRQVRKDPLPGSGEGL